MELNEYDVFRYNRIIVCQAHAQGNLNASNSVIFFNLKYD